MMLQTYNESCNRTHIKPKEHYCHQGENQRELRWVSQVQAADTSSAFHDVRECHLVGRIQVGKV
jgi:hypothetical protein